MNGTTAPEAEFLRRIARQWVDSPPGGGATIEVVHDALLPIGMFSRAAFLSVKTLRSYHEGGILVPASVDPRTGYRSYTVDQLADAAVIVRLRALDLPLDRVREVLDKRDPEHTRAVLIAHRVTMEQRLAETERIVAELQSGLVAATNTPVHVRTDPASHCLRVIGSVTAESFKSFLGWAYGRLNQVAAASGAMASGPPGALYESSFSGEEESVEAFIAVTDPVAIPTGEQEVSLGEVPAAEVAVLVHPGGYDSIDTTYRTLGAWVARNAEHADGRVREWYVMGPGQSDDPDHYRTEIAWPILPGSGPRPDNTNDEQSEPKL